MKSNKFNIILATLCMLVSVCFVAGAVKPTEHMSRGVASFIAVCYLISALIYICIYRMNKKRMQKD